MSIDWVTPSSSGWTIRIHGPVGLIQRQREFDRYIGLVNVQSRWGLKAGSRSFVCLDPTTHIRSLGHQGPFSVYSARPRRGNLCMCLFVCPGLSEWPYCKGVAMAPTVEVTEVAETRVPGLPLGMLKLNVKVAPSWAEVLPLPSRWLLRVFSFGQRDPSPNAGRKTFTSVFSIANPLSRFVVVVSDLRRPGGFQVLPEAFISVRPPDRLMCECPVAFCLPVCNCIRPATWQRRPKLHSDSDSYCNRQALIVTFCNLTFKEEADFSMKPEPNKLHLVNTKLQS